MQYLQSSAKATYKKKLRSESFNSDVSAVATSRASVTTQLKDGAKTFDRVRATVAANPALKGQMHDLFLVAGYSVSVEASLQISLSDHGRSVAGEVEKSLHVDYQNKAFAGSKVDFTDIAKFGSVFDSTSLAFEITQTPFGHSESLKALESIVKEMSEVNAFGADVAGATDPEKAAKARSDARTKFGSACAKMADALWGYVDKADMKQAANSGRPTHYILVPLGTRDDAPGTLFEGEMARCAKTYLHWEQVALDLEKLAFSPPPYHKATAQATYDRWNKVAEAMMAVLGSYGKFLSERPDKSDRLPPRAIRDQWFVSTNALASIRSNWPIGVESAPPPVSVVDVLDDDQPTLLDILSENVRVQVLQVDVSQWDGAPENRGLKLRVDVQNASPNGLALFVPEPGGKRSFVLLPSKGGLKLPSPGTTEFVFFVHDPPDPSKPWNRENCIACTAIRRGTAQLVLLENGVAVGIRTIPGKPLGQSCGCD